MLQIRKTLWVVAALTMATISMPAISADTPPEQSAIASNPDVGVPVFPYDISDRPYEVLGEVSAKVRKATIFSKDASQAKIYRELWERAQNLGADAVVKAQYGDSHVTAFSWGSTTATGVAVKFKAPAPAGSGPGSAP